MKYIILLITILLIFYLHGRMVYESLDTSFTNNNNIPQRCQNWRQLRFDVPPLVPGINVNIAETEAEIGELDGNEGFVGNFFNEKIKQFKKMYKGSEKGRGSFDIPKNENKTPIETMKDQINTALKGEPTKSVEETFSKVVPTINPTPQKTTDDKILINANKNNPFKMKLIKHEGNIGFYEGDCPDGWYHNGTNFTVTGDGIHIKECNMIKNNKADAFATLKNGKVKSIHIRKKGKYSDVPKVEIKSVDGRGSGAKGKVYLDKNGGIKRVEIINKGNGYESLPNIVFIDTKKICKMCIKQK